MKPYLVVVRCGGPLLGRGALTKLYRRSLVVTGVLGGGGGCEGGEGGRGGGGRGLGLCAPNEVSRMGDTCQSLTGWSLYMGTH